MLKEVEMIAIFDLEGHARPYRFRIESDEGLVTVKVNRVLKEDKMYKNVTYICECEVYGQLKEIELLYKYEDLKWFVRA